MRFAIVTAAIASICLSLSAQTPFDAVVLAILDNNADLNAQVYDVEAQRRDASDANALQDPSVEFARVWGNHGIGNKLQLDVSQSFDWPGVYSARQRAADSEYQAAKAQIDVARFEMAKEVRALLSELVYVRHQKAVIAELVDNFRQLGEAIDAGVRGGELTVLDQRKMQIENFEIDNDMNTALQREQQILTQLQALCTVPLDLSSIADYPIQPLLSCEEYVALASAVDPNVTLQKLTSDTETFNAQAASRSRMPGFSVGYQHQAEMGDRFNGFTVGMNLPVFQNRNSRRAALDRKQSADIALEGLLAKLKTEIQGTYAEILLQRDRLSAYQTTFGDNMYLTLLLKAYKGGQISVIEYLTEVHYYHQTMLLYLESEYNYHLSLSSLNCYSM